MKTILVPLDGSALAEQALVYARMLALLMSARVRLLHVVTEVDGIVHHGPVVKGMRRVIIETDEGTRHEYSVPRSVHVNVQETERVRAGDPLIDGPIDPRWTRDFFADDRHHLAVALDAGIVVGMASAVHYVHPDKRPELWVNEVGVAETHRGQGIGSQLLKELFAHGRKLGCMEAWVLTDESNAGARRLYARAGGVEEPALMYSFRL